MFNKNKKGFTLIELLMVISIIGLLSSIVLSSLSTARQKARDTKRIADLKQIQNAVELYAFENNYMRSSSMLSEGPPEGCGYGYDQAPGGSYSPGVWCKFETALSPYIKSLPRSVVNGSNYYYFVYKVPTFIPTNNPNNINLYGLSVKLEKANSASMNDGGTYPDWFEVGGLPAYCNSLGQNWASWNNSPCIAIP
jgi:prepilin-type N-terminal cleavage/methylation domain-containing protein